MISDENNTKKLIDIHKRRLQILKEKQAIYGLDTPAQLLMEIEDIEAKLQTLLAQLKPLEAGPGSDMPQGTRSGPAEKSASPQTAPASYREPQKTAFTQPRSVSTMARPTVFISYSHKDEEDKAQLVSHLGVLQQAGLLEIWDDDRIEGGSDWAGDIDQAINQAGVAILLITRNFLNSEFILNIELRRLFERRHQEGLVIFPVIGRACAWRQVDWLARLNVRPKNGDPVWRRSRSQADEALAKIAAEVHQLIEKARAEAIPRVHLHNWGQRPAGLPARTELLDWSGPGLFEDGPPRRVPPPETWQTTLLPQLRALPDKLRPESLVRLEGRCALSSGFAFGHTFRAVGRYQVEVVQHSPGREPEIWSSAEQVRLGQPEPTFTARTLPGSPAARDAAIVVTALTGTTPANVLGDAGCYFGEEETFRQMLDTGAVPRSLKGVLALEAETVTQGRPLDSGQAAALARTSRRSLSDFIRQFQPARLHLFLATPLSLAVFLGHHWNAISKPVQCYEKVGGDRVYAPVGEIELS